MTCTGETLLDTNKNYAQQLKDALKLRHEPVAVKLIREGEEFPACCSRPEAQMSHCQAVFAAKNGACLAMAAEDESCHVGSSALGMAETPEKVASGEFHAKIGMHDTPEAAAKMIAERKVIPYKVIGEAVCPLAKADFVPDTVEIVDIPERIYWVVPLETAERGGRVSFSTSPFQCACEDITVIPIVTGAPNISIGCFGNYSYRIVDPILFYTNVCGNVTERYERSRIDTQLKSEIQTKLQPAFARISAKGVRYSELPGHTPEITEELNNLLSDLWGKERGIAVVSFGMNSVTADEEDEKMIKELQKNAAFADPTRLAAYAGVAQADAMKMAASNTSAGPMMAFMGMNAAQQAGGGLNVNSLFAQGQAMQQQQAAQQPVQQPAMKAPSAAANTWTCSCGATVSGNFCPECGTKKPEAPAGWTCSCGAVNQGKFCTNCGTKKPAGVPQYKCDKCGWVPEDPKNPPKFCPDCGDPFGDEDIVQ